VAIEVRESDESTSRIVERISDAATASALTAERTVVDALGGGCQTTIGALATVSDRTDSTMKDELELIATVIALDGSRAIRASGRGPSGDAEAIGRRVAAQLLANGAEAILADVGAADVRAPGEH
jgi:hydroxymethylbilane synthase